MKGERKEEGWMEGSKGDGVVSLFFFNPPPFLKFFLICS